MDGGSVLCSQHGTRHSPRGRPLLEPVVEEQNGRFHDQCAGECLPAEASLGSGSDENKKRYAGRSHESVRAGAELLAVPTNTSSYGTSQVPSQEVAAAIVQSVETGRDLVQAAPTGFSAVVNQRGVVLQRSALGRRQVLFATVALRRGLTPYDHWGDLPVLVLAGLALLAGWARQVRYS